MNVNVVYDERIDRDALAKEGKPWKKRKFLSGPQERRLLFIVEVPQNEGMGSRRKSLACVGVTPICQKDKKKTS